MRLLAGILIVGGVLVAVSERAPDRIATSVAGYTGFIAMAFLLFFIVSVLIP